LPKGRKATLPPSNWKTKVEGRRRQPGRRREGGAPWPLKGGQPGSPNHVLIVRANGETERYAVVSGLTLNTDDVIRVMTATGAGCTLSPNPKGGLV